MYSVYRRLNGRYDLVANFKVLGEASAHADELRRQPSAGTRCWYYVTGPGLPVPTGLAVRQERQERQEHSVRPAPQVHLARIVRPVRATPRAHPAPARGIFGWLARLFRRAEPTPLPAQPSTPAAQLVSAPPRPPTRIVQSVATRWQPPAHVEQPVARQPDTAPAATGRDRSLGSRTFGRPADDRRVWADDERWDDIALAHRTEEELGIGISAQWGKGRRNRKGWYIP